MSRLRETLLEIQIEKTLRALLGDEAYEAATEEERLRYLSFVDDRINRDVDKMIFEEIERIKDNEPAVKANRKFKRFSLLIIGLGTLGMTLCAAFNHWSGLFISAAVFLVGLFMQFTGDE